MPGPNKVYSTRIKVSVTRQMAEELKSLAEATDKSQGEICRVGIEKYMRNLAKVAAKGPASERRESRRKKFQDEMDLAWGAYMRAREKWWRLVKQHAPPQEPKMTAKRADLILDSLEANGKEATVLAGKGIWLSDFHTEKGFTGPEYAWRASNVHKFSTLVLETRIGG